MFSPQSSSSIKTKENNLEESFTNDNTETIRDEEFTKERNKKFRDKQQIIYQQFDFDEIRKQRLQWGIFRDRREECYQKIVGK